MSEIKHIRTVSELVTELLKLDQSKTVGVHCHGCCNHAHDVFEVEDSEKVEKKELCHADADVVIRV